MKYESEYIVFSVFLQRIQGAWILPAVSVVVLPEVVEVDVHIDQNDLRVLMCSVVEKMEAKCEYNGLCGCALPTCNRVMVVCQDEKITAQK